MALNDIKVPKENAGGTFDEIALVAHQINAQTVFTTAAATYSTDQMLPAARATELIVSNPNTAGVTLTLPAAADGTLAGDTYVLVGGSTVAGPITIRRMVLTSPIIYANFSTSVITAPGQRYRFRATGSSGTAGWTEVSVDTHTHGNISHTGAIGRASGLPVRTGTDGVLQVGAFGSSAGQFAEGNHTHTAANITDFTSAVEAVSPPADWDTLANKPSTFTPTTHASTHHTGGSDALSPADIGAAATSHTHAASDVTSGVFDNARINFAAPAAIGNTTPAAISGTTGTFTTLTADNDLEITDSTKGIIMKSPNNTRWRVTIDNAGSLIRTALALLFLAAISSTGTAQVRDLVYGTNNVVVGPTNTNALTFTNNITATGTLGVSNAVTFDRANVGTTDGTLLWFGLPAQLSVQGTGGRHAIIANAPAGGGAAVVGKSSSGGAAGKFYQDTVYTSPALWVSRQAPSANSPTLGVGSSTTGLTNAKAISVSHGEGNEVFWVKYDGTTSITNVAWSRGLTNSTYSERLVFDGAAGRLTYFASQTNDPVIAVVSSASIAMLGLRGTNAFFQSRGNLRIEAQSGVLTGLQASGLITSGGQTNSLPAVNATLVPWMGSASSDPASPVEGAIYFNTTNSTVRIYAGGAWRTLN